MRKFCIQLFLIFSFFTGAGAQTIEVSSDILENTIWDVDTVHIIQSIELDRLQTLTINPGVVIVLDNDVEFAIRGIVKAKGDIGDSIVFTSKSPGNFWNGLKIDSPYPRTDTSEFKYCIFERSSGEQGGVFKRHQDYGQKVLISNSTFRYNQATQGGVLNSAIYNSENSFYKFYNCLFYRNSAAEGGVAYMYYDAEFVNCTLVNNSADVGGAMYFHPHSSEYYQYSEIKNVLIWGNGTDPIYVEDSIFFLPKYSIIEGGMRGVHIVDSDPLFVDGENDNYNLLSGSPAVDNGCPCVKRDSDGSYSDIGALSYFQPDFVGNVGTIIKNGTLKGQLDSLNSPYYVCNPIQVAEQDSLFIGPGTHIYFANKYEFDVYGSLQIKGTNDSPVIMDALDSTTSWNPIGNVEYFQNGWGGITLHSGASNIVFENVRIKNIGDHYYFSPIYSNGNGIVVDSVSDFQMKSCIMEKCYGSLGVPFLEIINGSSVVIENSRFLNSRDNGWTFTTAGIVAQNSKLRISNSIFEDCNLAQIIKSEKSDIALINNEIKNNNVVTKTLAIYSGEGDSIYIHNNKIFNNNGRVSIQSLGGITIVSNNYIINNNGGYNGALELSYGEPRVYNNVIAYNEFGVGAGNFWGAAIDLTHCNAKIYNNTIMRNKGGRCGGIYASYSTAEIVNNILYENYPNDYGWYNGAIGMADPILRNNLMEIDPKFNLGDSLDISLSDNSPAIDSGDSTGLVMPDYDFFGNPRLDLQYGVLDIGASEFVKYNNLPKGIELTSNTFDPSYIPGDVIAKVIVADDDDLDDHLITVSEDDNFPDNNIFTILGDNLVLLEAPNTDKTSYNIEIRADDGRSGYIEKEFNLSYLITGIHHEESKLLVYPNPTNDFIYVDDKRDAVIKVYNSQGTLILISTERVIDLREVKNGILFLEIGYKDQLIIEKIIKQ